MGRVSKRKTAGIHSEQNVKVRRYRAGIYDCKEICRRI